MNSLETVQEQPVILPDGLLDFENPSDDDYGIDDHDKAEQIVPRVIEYLKTIPSADRQKVFDVIAKEWREIGRIGEGYAYSQVMCEKFASLVLEKL